jgi:calcium permeable stress-gated cation channel
VPYPTTSVHVGRRVGLLPALIEDHNSNVRELERYLIRYLKEGRIGKKRPTATIGGFLGFGGRKVDAIDYYAQKIRESEEKVDAYRAQIDRNKAENYGFASMAAVPYAHIVAQMLRNKSPKGTTIQLAPNPKDIVRCLFICFTPS